MSVKKKQFRALNEIDLNKRENGNYSVWNPSLNSKSANDGSQSHILEQFTTFSLDACIEWFLVGLIEAKWQ